MLAKWRSYATLNILANVIIGSGLGLVLFITTGQPFLLASSTAAGVVGGVIAANMRAGGAEGGS